MGDDQFSDLGWKTPNELNQFIGHSDYNLPGYGPGDVPRAITHQLPESSEDLASIASFMHAPLISTHHEAMIPVIRDWPGNPLGNYNVHPHPQWSPRALAWSSSNNGFMQPAHIEQSENDGAKQDRAAVEDAPEVAAAGDAVAP